MTTTVEPFKNIVVMTSNNISTINKLLMITQITHDQTTHSVSVYAPAARETCKGVIHQVERNTDPATLMQLLTAPPGFNIVAARMMGGSTTAIITFEGTYIPLSVSLGGAIHRCKPHRPKAQICFKCLGLGHRADVCTRATTARCPQLWIRQQGRSSHVYHQMCELSGTASFGRRQLLKETRSRRSGAATGIPQEAQHT
ncbi:hypothetical protein HPB48_002006 [Haemaphysalis longicornis]|uniref:CCHC-type domain-containing protein n=1 Tax=Haemaphysalis longicornis TaxID=44386 RepID=A0A9J6FU54_HAELO|nr:hypothetical protein HPB48_002006 [Haemaphysalis longicornis]